MILTALLLFAQQPVVDRQVFAGRPHDVNHHKIEPTGLAGGGCAHRGSRTGLVAEPLDDYAPGV